MNPSDVNVYRCPVCGTWCIKPRACATCGEPFHADH